MMLFPFEDVMDAVCDYCVFSCSPAIDQDALDDECEACDAAFMIGLIYAHDKMKEP